MDLIAHEDEHLLVARKPAGWNTHAPDPFANEGLYEWLKHREPRWSSLAIIHRLDKETSGLIVFGKTPEANRSLTAQFEGRQVSKKYIFLTDRGLGKETFTARSHLLRLGDKYSSQPEIRGGALAETRFRCLAPDGPNFLWEAEPLTGRTHQIRVHASENGLPILGEVLYGGTAAQRLCLHAAELRFAHPVTGAALDFRDAPDFSASTAAALRQACIAPLETNAFRLLHGAADGCPGFYADRLGEFVLTSSENAPTSVQLALASAFPARGLYHKKWARAEAKQSPQLLSGEAAPPDGFWIRENGLQFKLSFAEGYSFGLFLDQRDNRRRLLTGHIAAGFSMPPSAEVLNAFAYTCAFSVCAAARGARATSLDLSKKYLEWGRDNFRGNSLDPAGHEFLAGDVFDWFGRLARKKRVFDMVLLDPPTFSRSKESGVFQAEKDYGRLVSAALPLVKKGGLLFASTNAADFAPPDFLQTVTQSIQRAGRRLARQHYAPQPPDFPIHRAEQAYLKTVWIVVN